MSDTNTTGPDTGGSKKNGLQQCFNNMTDALIFARTVMAGDLKCYPHDGNLSIIMTKLTDGYENKTVFYVEDGIPFIRTWERLIWEWSEDGEEILHYDAREKPELKTV